MRKALVVSFDVIREGEPEIPLAIASLLASLKSSPGYGADFEVESRSINLLACDTETAVQSAMNTVFEQGFDACDTVAVGCYVWAEAEASQFILRLRDAGYRNKIVLGGPQISYAKTEQLPQLYPQADIFVRGYAEVALHSAILMPRPAVPAVLAEEVSFDDLPSPYLSGDLPVVTGQGRVRMETRRGCPFRCSFCAHRDLKKNKVHRHPRERATAEWDFLTSNRVGKVNVLDPVFNEGKDYLPLMKHMVQSDFHPLVTFQTRFELILKPDGECFLDLAGQMNAHLEFGLQTALESEAKSVNRRNPRDAVRSVMRMLNEQRISYEVSLIYGLPGQTPASFAESILFLRENGCDRITAFPLMLLRGTELFEQKERWGYRERPEGRFGIPVVYESNWFSEGDWWMMKQMADDLTPNERI